MDPGSGYTIDHHLAPTGAAAHEVVSAGHRWILVKLSLRETQQRQVEAHMRRLSAVCLQKMPGRDPGRSDAIAIRVVAHINRVAPYAMPPIRSTKQ